MIQYSRKALEAITRLFKSYNDIDVFVEDTANRNMYEILIQRILEDRARVRRVFPLPGRDEVLKACRGDQGERSRRRIYIIDADMDLFLGTERPNLKHLYRLNVYTSENLVLSEEAAVEVAYESSPTKEKDILKAEMDLRTLLSESAVKLRQLFILYAVKRYLEIRDGKHIHIETVALKIEKLGLDTANGIDLVDGKIYKRTQEVRSKLSKEAGYSKSEIDATEKTIAASVPDDPVNLLRYISGKTYLLPLVYHRLTRIAHCHTTKEQLKTRLARFCDLNADPSLSSAILAVSQGNDIP